MLQLIQAENLKLKRTFAKKIFVVAPCLVLALAFFMTKGLYNSFPAGAWNWWYTLFLPATLAISCNLIVNKDKKKKYHNIFGIGIKPQKAWTSKIILCSILFLSSNLIMSIGTLVGGLVFGTYIPITGNLLAAVVLTITYLWEIPFFLFLSARFGMFVCVITGVFLAFASTAIMAPTRLWWTLLSAIPIRLMSPIIFVQPNGLPVYKDSPLLNFNVVLPGIAITVIAFLLLTGITARWFVKREER